MWSAGSEIVDVFLGRARLGLQRRGEPVEWRTGGSGGDLWPLALDAVQATRCASARVWLSGSLARPFILPAMEGLISVADVRTVAASRAPEETGLEGPCRVSIDAWKPGSPTVCVAMEEGLRTAIETGEESKRVRVTSIRPWWAAVLCDRATDPRSLTLLTVDDGESLVVLAGAEDRIELASSYAPAPDDAQRAALVQRVLSAAGLGLGAHRHAGLSAASEPTSAPLTDSPCPFPPIWRPAP